MCPTADKQNALSRVAIRRQDRTTRKHCSLLYSINRVTSRGGWLCNLYRAVWLLHEFR
jgi:hypothetical protein